MKVSRKSTKFLWVGNSPAIDFVNTRIVQAGVTIDLLESGADLERWLGEAGLLPPDGVPALSRNFADRALQAALDYRAELRRALESITKSGLVPEASLDVTNALLASGTGALRLRRRGRRFELRHAWRFAEPRALCAPVALAFARLLSEGEFWRIRRCQNPECILFFYDTSKSGTRAWCSLQTCGNKLRAKAFRKRHAARRR